MLDFVDIYIANLSRKTYSYQLARKNLKYYKSLFKTRWLESISNVYSQNNNHRHCSDVNHLAFWITSDSC